MSDGLNAAPRFADPSRPTRVSNLPPSASIPRPWLVFVVVGAVVLAAIAFTQATARILIDQRDFRTLLEHKLADRAPDYSQSDVETAVLVGVIVLAVLSVLFMVGELRATARLLEKRRSARTGLLVLTLLHLPIVGATAQAYEGDRYVGLGAAVGAGALVLAVATVYLWPIGRWLKVSQRQGPIPLRPSSPQG
ncbi:MAG: hypothetical protein QOH68_2188 [Nocardioidaceae bacterium]|jgi:hypothetical protein|nr:hypothetical protein [Nocardioidaceae bacterium]